MNILFLNVKKLKKPVFIGIILFFLLFFSVDRIIAQSNQQNSFRSESKTVITRVGNAPKISGPLTEVLAWATHITSALEPGIGNLLNRMVQVIKNGGYTAAIRAGRDTTTGGEGMYWCTTLVIDAYGLAGYQDFTHAAHSSVFNLEAKWREVSQSAGRYRYIDYRSNKRLLVDVQPGDVMFHLDPGGDRQIDHTSIVQEIFLNSQGDGKITTLNSNSSRTILTYTVVGWEILSLGSLPPVVGFGSIIEIPVDQSPGSPNPSPPAGSLPTTALFLKAARDIKTAYDVCAGGLTYDANGIRSCLSGQLQQIGYSSANVSAFEARRRTTITDPNKCTECLGYVAIALTLVTGNTNTLTQPSAASVLNSSEITAGGLRFVKMPTGTLMQVGDIAVAGGGFGHIAIVDAVIDGTIFRALESNNTGNNCRVTNTRLLPAIRQENPYVFYRQQ